MLKSNESYATDQNIWLKNVKSAFPILIVGLSNCFIPKAGYYLLTCVCVWTETEHPVTTLTEVCPVIHNPGWNTNDLSGGCIEDVWERRGRSVSHLVCSVCPGDLSQIKVDTEERGRGVVMYGGVVSTSVWTQKLGWLTATAEVKWRCPFSLLTIKDAGGDDFLRWDIMGVYAAQLYCRLCMVLLTTLTVSLV